MGGPGAPSDAANALVAAAWGPLRTSASSPVFSLALIPVCQVRESIFSRLCPHPQIYGKMFVGPLFILE